MHRQADDTLDLRGLPCPGNLPKVLMRLEAMGAGEILLVILDDIVALDKIPPAIEEDDAFEMLSISKYEDMNIHVFIKVR
jgi:TusA-related sulfurtransferase